jgi:D-sedoheptulose 7-phosphate isomerase
LTVNSSSLTAIGNDYSFDEVFSRQIEAYGSPGDVAVGISTSGNSANVSEGLKAAKQRGLVTVGLTGKGGEKLKPMADFCLCVPSSDTPRIQEGHLLMEHILSEFVEGELFPAPEI